MKRKNALVALALLGFLLSCGQSGREANDGDSSSYSSLSSEELPSSGESASEVPSYWKGLDFSKQGNAFREDLQTLIKGYKTKTTTYSDCLSIGAKAASFPEGSSTFVPFYHAAPGTSQGVSGKGALTVTQDQCNREHTWPNSRGSGKKEGPGCDPFIVRPTLKSENSGRQNFFYGYASTNEWDPASCGYEGARGESSRVILYAATAYYLTCGSGGSSKGNAPFELSNDPSDATIEHTMGTLKTLLQWNKDYAPSAMEIQINDYLYEEGYGRNPFVDCPELAFCIWDDEGVIGEKAS